MKKIRYIIAAVFVVAIGTVMFLSCEKENTNSSINEKETQKNMYRLPPCTWKDVNYYEWDFTPDRCYHVTGEYCIDFNANIIWYADLRYTPIKCSDIPHPVLPEPFEATLTPIGDFNTVEDITNPNNYEVIIVEGEPAPPYMLNILLTNSLIYMVGNE